MRKGPVFKSNAQCPRSETTGTEIAVIAEHPSVLLNTAAVGNWVTVGWLTDIFSGRRTPHSISFENKVLKTICGFFFSLKSTSFGPTQGPVRVICAACALSHNYVISYWTLALSCACDIRWRLFAQHHFCFSQSHAEDRLCFFEPIIDKKQVS